MNPGSNAKPFFLLMPNYFCAKDFYDDALASSKSVLYLCPRKRYFYWTPKGLRKRSKVDVESCPEVASLETPGMADYLDDIDEETKLKVAAEAGYPQSIFEKPKKGLDEAAIRAAAAEDWFSTKAPAPRGRETEPVPEPAEEAPLRKDGGNVLKCLEGLDWELIEDEESLAVNVTFSDSLWFRLCGVTGYSAFKEAVSFELAEQQLRVLHAGSVVLDLQLPSPVDAPGASASVSSRKMRVAVKARKLSKKSS
ncbi:unnamed protein product [Symbiodinium pilosum]|uniref:Uncharacterized protein n=1 Tax=Symbiodinium pilosum TaxID=2952 RepID=A0A812QZH2_SYMPI|nr:unnamed protein product [Symbiodinium pilosum]